MEYLIPSELKFISSDNNVLGLKYLDKEYKAIKLKRCFPFNNPNFFICVNIASNTGIQILLTAKKLTCDSVIPFLII